MEKNNENLYVAMVFFVRPEPLKLVFEKVRKAKPQKLFLIQDGPRKDSDMEKMEECRKIVSNIDWPCEVYTNYSEENLGCGRRIYSGIKWAFEFVDRLVILEDDCVPADSFFPFCNEVLDKYIDDERVCMISGMNHLGSYSQANTDYIFSYTGSIAGWATWKRCWDAIDFDLEFLNDSYIDDLLLNLRKYGNKYYTWNLKNLKNIKRKIDTGEKLKSWSFQFKISTMLNSQLVIVPKYNLMTNCGITENATNSPSDLKYIPKKLQKLYNLETYENKFQIPLKHPKYVALDYNYSKQVFEFMKGKNGFDRMLRVFEFRIRRIMFGDFKGLCKSIMSHINRK